MKFNAGDTSEYKKISLEETFKFLETTFDGLTGPEAENRLKIFGYNEITEEDKHSFFDFLLRYWGPMPWLLEIAIFLSFILNHYIEGIIIFVLLTLNAVISQIHSNDSKKAVELLRKKLAVKAKVLRDGKWVTKDAGEIVPGDIITVKLGDVVPADAEIINGEISVDESALTGESLPVDIQHGGVIYSGSQVRHGDTKCVVVNTGANTFFGKTTELVKIARPKSHQEEIMMDIVKYMMYVGLGASILVSVYAFFTHVHILLILTFVVIFLMGAIPVALPAVLVIVQTVCATELAEKGVLVTRLDSIEDAASIDVICFDKTGTVTQNKISVKDAIPFSGNKKEDILAIAALASKEESMDIMDLAVTEYTRANSIDLSGYKQISYTPFNPSIKRTEAVIETSGIRFKAVKGAIQVILGMCRETDKKVIDDLNRAVEEFSKKGYRIIAVAKSEAGNPDNLRLEGLILLSDPPRPDSLKMINEVKELGIKPMMLTGDNISIAREISHQTGIGDKIIRMRDIEGLSENEKLRLVTESDGFAEIYPEDKYKIVKLLQSGGYIVGMTGDGINDAPALKQAEMGIAVSGATDVAKASASMVLTEEGLGVIIDALKISRKIYQRMLTWVINKVTKVIEFTGLLTAGYFWLHDIVLSLSGMSLLVFSNDFVTMSLATDNVGYTSKPNKWNVKNVTLSSLIPGMLLVIEGLIVILIGLKYFHLQGEKLHTLVMLDLVFNSQFRVMIVRERRHFWASPPGKNLFILSAVTIMSFTLLGISGFLVPPLALYQVLTVLGISAFSAVLIDFPKYYLFRRFEL